MSTTLKDIAQKVGVSEMTVSRALRDSDQVSATTKKRIFTTAQSLGYVQNKIAGSLASNRVDLVSVVIPSVKSYVFSEVLDGISTTLVANSRLRPVFALTNYDLEQEEQAIMDMLAWRPSGLIIAGLEHTPNAQRILSALDIPLVEIMDTDGTPVSSCVGISHRRAGRKMAQTIYQRGYRHIGFIGTKMSFDFRAQKRLEGFEQEMQKYGIALVGTDLYSEGSSIDGGKRLTAALLAKHPEIDCIYYSTDVSAVGGMIYCLEENIPVPEKLALAGFNQLNLLNGLPKALASTNSMRFEIGKKAAEIIINQQYSVNPTEEKQIIELTPTVSMGDTL